MSTLHLKSTLNVPVTNKLADLACCQIHVITLAKALNWSLMFRDLVSVKWRKLSELGWDLMIIDTRHLSYITSHFLFCITNCMFNNFSKLVLRELAFGFFSIIGLQKYIQPLTYLSDRRVENFFERFNYGIFF